MNQYGQWPARAKGLQALQDLIRAVLTGTGHTPAMLRQAAEAQAARLGGSQRPKPALPPEIERYVIKVSQQAHAVTDEDVSALLTAGYSEDAVFELTISAALGAGRARLERGLAVLQDLP